MKKYVALLSILLLASMASPALAQSTISALQNGQLIQTTDNVAAWRPGCTHGGDCRVQFGSLAAAGPGPDFLINGGNLFLNLGNDTASLQLPVGTTAQRPSPAPGMIRYNSTVPQLEAYIAGSWTALGSGGGGSFSLTSTGPGIVLGSSPWTGGTNTIALGTPTTSTLGGILALASSTSHQFLTYIDNTGAQHMAQPVAADISGLVASATTDTTNASNIGSGSLALGRIASIAANTILGETASAAPIALAVPSCSGATNALIWTTGTGFGCNTIAGGGSVSVTAVSGTRIVVSPSPGTGTFTLDTGSAIPTSASNLSFFAATTSAQLAGVLSDETGTGAAVFAGSPTLTGTVSGAAATWSGVDTALNFSATGTGADQLPAGTTAQRPGSPANGMFRYNSTTSAVESYISAAWTSLLSALTANTPDISVSCTAGVCTVGSTQPINPQVGTSYTVLSSDMGKTITQNNASASAYTLPQAGTTGFALGTSFSLINQGVGPMTLTPTSSTINGNSTLVLQTGQGGYIISDGANWVAFLGAINGVAYLAKNQTFTASQRAPVQTITISTSTFTPNFDTGSDFVVGLTSGCPCTLANPSTTPVAGQHGIIHIVQDGTGSRTIGTWGTLYVISGGVAGITLSTGANAIDVFSYEVKDSTHIVLSTPALNVTH